LHEFRLRLADDSRSTRRFGREPWFFAEPGKAHRTAHFRQTGRRQRRPLHRSKEGRRNSERARRVRQPGAGSERIAERLSRFFEHLEQAFDTYRVASAEAGAELGVMCE